MTIEEARKVLDGELLVLTLENNVASEAQKKRLNEKFAALNVALEAIDKQIPKQPIEKSPWVYHCPNCDSQKIEDVFIERFRYCRDCGQALDWSDNDD